MEKLILKRIKLNFDKQNSETIEFKNLKEKFESEIKSEYSGMHVFFKEDLITITNDYIILAFDVKKKKFVKSY